MSEFAIINDYFAKLVDQHANNTRVDLGIGDDAAVLNVHTHEQLVVSTDTMNSGQHFPENAPAQGIAYRALAAAASDLAAMAAEPLAFTLSISLPDNNSEWLEAFTAGLAQASQDYCLPLIGGDTTKGPLSIAIQVMGTVPLGKAVKRSTAKYGDDLYVTGHLGDAALALSQVLNQKVFSATDAAYLQAAFYYPKPTLAVAKMLRSYATAMIDISDGIHADAGHIAAASHCGFKINVNKIPLSACLRNNTSADKALELALAGGDDYQLCFTAQPQNRSIIKELAENMQYPISHIGEVIDGKGVQYIDDTGKPLMINLSAFDHFNK